MLRKPFDESFKFLLLTAKQADPGVVSDLKITNEAEKVLTYVNHLEFKVNLLISILKDELKNDD